MRDYRIREAAESDIAEVARVFKTSREAALPFLQRLHTPDEDFEFFSKVVFEKDVIFVAIACDTNAVCGFIAFNKDFVDHLYLLPDAQGFGLGAQLLDIAKKQSDCLKLWTFQKNAIAKKFYEAQGFSQIEETDGAGNEEREPDVLFEWRSETTTASP